MFKDKWKTDLLNYMDVLWKNLDLRLIGTNNLILEIKLAYLCGRKDSQKEINSLKELVNEAEKWVRYSYTENDIELFEQQKWLDKSEEILSNE